MVSYNCRPPLKLILDLQMCQGLRYYHRQCNRAPLNPQHPVQHLSRSKLLYHSNRTTIHSHLLPALIHPQDQLLLVYLRFCNNRLPNYHRLYQILLLHYHRRFQTLNKPTSRRQHPPPRYSTSLLPGLPPRYLNPFRTLIKPAMARQSTMIGISPLLCPMTTPPYLPRMT